MDREEIGIRLLNTLHDMGISKDAAVGILAMMKTQENWRLILEELDDHSDYNEDKLLHFTLALKEVLKESEEPGNAKAKSILIEKRIKRRF